MGATMRMILFRSYSCRTTTANNCAAPVIFPFGAWHWPVPASGEADGTFPGSPCSEIPYVSEGGWAAERTDWVSRGLLWIVSQRAQASDWVVIVVPSLSDHRKVVALFPFFHSSVEVF